jgi:hypothetical protein
VKLSIKKYDPNKNSQRFRPFSILYYINELETGKKINPTIQILEKLAKALGVSIAELTERAG